ncbi:ABC transporter permease [Burkholderia plantarii]|uniref:ABC transporter permease n=1 Tax=Burkholderia plantarii TaxID=41899 RepID=UPI00272DBA36|nr:ABC transporter permease subunit [Burkholderia plantarii]
MNSSVIGKFAEDAVNFLFQHFRGGFDAFSAALGAVIKLLEDGLAAVPFVAMLVFLVAFALWRRGVVFSIFVGIALLAIHYMGLWAQTVSTLALVVAATVFSLVIGVPLGIWGARNKRVEMVLRSLLDFMQTMPAFVYLIPAVILFGLGRVPAVIATIVFAMPPVVRLTTLGIRQVREELLEAGRSFGSTDAQLLWKIQLPNALPSIMAGVNQTIMMAPPTKRRNLSPPSHCSRRSRSPRSSATSLKRSGWRCDRVGCLSSETPRTSMLRSRRDSAIASPRPRMCPLTIARVRGEVSIAPTVSIP